MLRLAILLVCTAAASWAAPPGTMKIISNPPAIIGAVAWATFDDTTMTAGWSLLNVQTNASFVNSDQMYAAGYVEGHVMQWRITQFLVNAKEALFGPEQPADMWTRVTGWFKAHVDWVKQQCSEKQQRDPMWAAVCLLMAQVEGLATGYNLGLNDGTPLDIVTATMWNAAFDVGDVRNAVYKELRTNCWDPPTEGKLHPIMREFIESHCSVMIHPILTNGKVDVGFAHTNWVDYRFLMRTVKTYIFPLSRLNATEASASDKDNTKQSNNEAGLPYFSVMMSSYPSMITSTDDFYILPDRGLFVTETTNTICNGSLYESVKPQSLVAWQRTGAANLLAKDGRSWTEIFSQYNSGTYNNQFMILDTRLFVAPLRQNTTQNLPFPPNFLWIVEQMPGWVKSADVTNVLNDQGYWPSYNRPYFPDGHAWMGFTKAAQVYGDYFTYDNAPRAQIFDREEVKVRDIASLQRLIMLNDYQHDELSQGNPNYAIAARGDLAFPLENMPYLQPLPDGAIDAKVTSIQSALPGCGGAATKCSMWAVDSPSHDQLPPFDWNHPRWRNLSHVGMPAVWNFGWQLYQF